MQKRLKTVQPLHWKLGSQKEKSRIGQKLLVLDLDSSLEHSQPQGLSNLRKSFQQASPDFNNRIGVLSGRSISE